MIENLNKFEAKEPELIVEWNDNESDARGWLVINSLRGGAAGGGTRMRKGLDLQEMILLSKTMEIKFTVSGPAIGGAKSGINFDPFDPRKKDVLTRWFRAILPLLQNCYGTGGDLNIDYNQDIIPLTKELSVLHPQEGILAGHLQGENKDGKARQLFNGTSKAINDPKYSPDPAANFTIADLVSGYSVSESVIHYYRTFGGNHQGKRAIIQGWGNVGSAAGYYLSQAGVKIVAIFDKYGGVINEDGFDTPDVRKLMIERKAKNFNSQTYLSFYEMNERFWSLPAEIFIPAAASRLITRDQTEELIRSGVELISCGANVPFADNEAFFGPIAEYADNQISVVPDFIANCGMARVFAYLMQDDVDLSAEAIFQDVSETISQALRDVHNGGCSGKQLTQSAFEIALSHIM
jgi:glutamate dehydrogenase/leucine dehydrogenase